jgi:hypothetical protein
VGSTLNKSAVVSVGEIDTARKNRHMTVLPDQPDQQEKHFDFFRGACDE